MPTRGARGSGRSKRSWGNGGVGGVGGEVEDEDDDKNDDETDEDKSSSSSLLLSSRQEDADYKKLTYPTADCGSGYAPLTQSECKAVPGYDYQRELSYDKNWIGGCFEWYRYSNGENTKKLYFNKGNAVEGKIGGNKICKKVKVLLLVAHV